MQAHTESLVPISVGGARHRDFLAPYLRSNWKCQLDVRLLHHPFPPASCHQTWHYCNMSALDDLRSHCIIRLDDVAQQEPSLLLKLLVVQLARSRQFFHDIAVYRSDLSHLSWDTVTYSPWPSVSTMDPAHAPASCSPNLRFRGASWTPKLFTMLAACLAATSHSFAEFPVTQTSST